MPPSRPRRRERQEQTREQLLDAASRVFARRGFRDATLEEIAAEAGYSTGAVYSNFANKEDLFHAAFEREVARDVEAVQMAQSTTADTPAERTRASARVWMSIIRERPEMFLLLIEQWARAARDPQHQAEFAERFRGLQAAAARWVTEEAERGGYEWDLPPEHVALGTNAILLGLSLQYYAHPESVPEDLVETLELALLSGIRKRRRSG